MEVTQVPERFFDFTEQENWSLQLVIMQLSKHDYQLNKVFRHELAKRLQDFDQQVSPAIRVFISDLIQVAPITKANKKATLVRDVLIIWALMILKILGTKPTINEATIEATQGEKISGSQLVFEALHERQIGFADSAKTIEKIWERRYKRFQQIDCEHLLPSD
jgi:hypothetical protein